jgi:hypothetical protein
MRVWTTRIHLGPDATGKLPQATVPASSAAVPTNLQPERFQSPSLLLLQFLAKSAGVRLWESTLHLQISGSLQKRQLLPLLVHLWQYTLQRIPGSRQKRQLLFLPVHLWQYALQRIPGSRQKRQLSPLLVPLLPLLRRSLTQDSSRLTSSTSFNGKHRRTRRSAQQHWCLSARRSTHYLYVRELEPHQVLPRLRISGFLQTLVPLSKRLSPVTMPSEHVSLLEYFACERSLSGSSWRGYFSC